MVCVSFPPGRHLVLCAVALATGLAVTADGRAADLYDGYGGGYYGEAPPRYGPPPYGAAYDPLPPVRRRVEGAEAFCRIMHRRMMDRYGREVVRRIRECDEGVVAWRPGLAARGPVYNDVPRGHVPHAYEPRVYAPGAYEPPRPPRDVGPVYEDGAD